MWKMNIILKYRNSKHHSQVALNIDTSPLRILTPGTSLIFRWVKWTECLRGKKIPTSLWAKNSLQNAAVWSGFWQWALELLKWKTKAHSLARQKWSGLTLPHVPMMYEHACWWTDFFQVSFFLKRWWMLAGFHKVWLTLSYPCHAS